MLIANWFFIQQDWSPLLEAGRGDNVIPTYRPQTYLSSPVLSHQNTYIPFLCFTSFSMSYKQQKSEQACSLEATRSQGATVTFFLTHSIHEEFPSLKRKTGGFDLMSVSGHF